MKIQVILILVCSIILSCGTKKPNITENESKPQEELTVSKTDTIIDNPSDSDLSENISDSLLNDPRVVCALNFINNYASFRSGEIESWLSVVDWINSNELVTDRLKKEVDEFINDAIESDPDQPLPADPFFDAQDNSNSYTIKSIDSANYLIVRGKEWADHLVAMKVENVNGKWLVDGCGIFMPDEKRAPR